MNKQCPVCKKYVDEAAIKTCQDAEDWVMKAIKKNHPQWVASDGSCPKCLAYYDGLGKKSAF